LAHDDRTRPTELVETIVHDADRLLGLHADLLRCEFRQIAAEASPALVSIGAGAGLTVAGGLLGSLMLVHGLHRSTRLPLWGCFGLVGGLLGTIGVGLVVRGRRRLSGVSLLPRETLATLREDLEWIRHATTG
jgi:Putative Actinobacterial Holin-X, holin superfamily III